jgi:hypothetical protein
MGTSFAKQQAIKMRRLERQEQQSKKEMDREIKLANAAGMTWLQWKQQQPAPPDTPVQPRNYDREAQMRRAIKKAEKQVDAARSPKWRALPFEERMRMLDAAKAAARKAAREDLRARWAKEDATTEVAMPPHITRLSPDSVPRDAIEMSEETK